MTRPANRLTSGAKAASRPDAEPLTIGSVEIRAFMNAFEQLGYESNGLLAAIGATRLALEDPDLRLPCDAYGRLLAAAASERRTPNIALRLAMKIPIGAFLLLDYLVLTCSTSGEGLKQLARYFKVTRNPVVLSFVEDRDPHEVLITGSSGRAPDPFSAEFTVALTTLHMRTETGGRFRLSRVAFAHQPDDVEEFARVLECPVSANAGWSGMSVPREMWTLPMRRRDPILHGVLERQAAGLTAAEPADVSMSGDVRRALAKGVAGVDISVERVARELAVSPRTLQRRLAAEGTTFQRLLDEFRMHAARLHVAGSDLSISEVAFLLGYSEPAPFHRAFKRWYGQTPQSYRQNARG